ncbi:uncharacterized protein LOC114935416 isoform X2 [Nylanderia fulva]|uniref:uncharacterized protein LOC114935416 isoform X2 n=1 Tax=Nylanderia fulva TaxID=613905 RepID=UPI0010FAD1C9|nr:uncharacterized protein LOC114935416 isoform X2 [Nylanderia fulva]
MEIKQEIERNVKVEALFKFAITNLHKYIKSNEDFTFSPYNIYEGLLSVYLISSYKIEEYLKEIFYLTKVSKDDLINNINFDNSKYCESTSTDNELNNEEEITSTSMTNCEYENLLIQN